MGKFIKIYGQSDDLFYVEHNGVEGADELDEVGCFYTIAWLNVSSESEGTLKLIGSYINPGVWAMGLAPTDEDVPMPNWPITYELGGLNYSTALTIQLPDDAVVSDHFSKSDD